MNIDVEVPQISEINLWFDGILDVVNSDAFGREAATEWHRLYKDWVPHRNGVLYDDVNIEPWEIRYNSIYARYQYNGDNFHFYKGHHHNAGSRWDQRAEPTQKPKLIQTLQKYLDRMTK